MADHIQEIPLIQAGKTALPQECLSDFVKGNEAVEGNGQPPARGSMPQQGDHPAAQVLTVRTTVGVSELVDACQEGGVRPSDDGKLLS